MCIVSEFQSECTIMNMNIYAPKNSKNYINDEIMRHLVG